MTPPRPRRARAALAALTAGAVLLPGLLVAAPARADSIREQQQWALDAIHAPDAWETTRGEGITVAVLDTGVDPNHPDLAGAVLPEHDLVGMGAGPGDPTWAAHGTAMAGIIAGRGHGAERGSGVIGVAPAADILPVRVLLEENDPARDEARRSTEGALAEGIRWATDQGADVINLSLGDDSESAHADPEQDAAVRYALEHGVVVVASAGNGGDDGNPVSYPAGYPGVIAVTAVDRSGATTDFSTRRWYSTVSAPGEGVIVADPDGQYYTGWGTSAAAAFVSGSVALLLAAHPGLTPAQVRDLLTGTAQNTPEGGRDDAFGAGIVDPAAAIEAAAGVEPASLEPLAEPYGERYFGPGPRPAAADPGTPWLAPAAGVTGALLLLTAVLLVIRLRRRTRAPWWRPHQW
ncbi:type VII secretion-associated serine protease mycosin [Streptomyces sp. RFCAC02]|uniref:type VII secretion-associated serine protease mycosin n=1 Tax=Streptomyces sp. RFCAC02 TaxID=2499143 RepID=UPI00101F5541|nr:type VII secretion-associated serine protease mycosin [Streptomyces sp. RFCAC02]